MNVIGIDMASAKPSTLAAINDQLEVREIVDVAEFWQVVDIVRGYQPAVIALDSPLGFPRGMCCLETACPCVQEGKGRLAEQELSKLGISSYYTTKKTIIKPMIYKAIDWAKNFRQEGYKVIEIYPYASKVRLFGKPVPNKSTKEGLIKLHSLLCLLGVDVHDLNHDQIDAVIAAYTGLLYVRGQTVEVGTPAESTIVLPKER